MKANLESCLVLSRGSVAQVARGSREGSPVSEIVLVLRFQDGQVAISSRKGDVSLSGEVLEIQREERNPSLGGLSADWLEATAGQWYLKRIFLPEFEAAVFRDAADEFA
jgi:hypothetical protein